MVAEFVRDEPTELPAGAASSPNVPSGGAAPSASGAAVRLAPEGRDAPSPHELLLFVVWTGTRTMPCPSSSSLGPRAPSSRRRRQRNAPDSSAHAGTTGPMTRRGGRTRHPPVAEETAATSSCTRRGLPCPSSCGQEDDSRNEKDGPDLCRTSGDVDRGRHRWTRTRLAEDADRSTLANVALGRVRHWSKSIDRPIVTW